MAKSKGSSSGISTLSLLGIVFVVLKLCNVINWSWWYVTLPFWGMAAVAIIILIVVAIIYMLKD